MAKTLLSKLNPLRGWKPSLWAGFLPNGLGEVKPNHFLEMAQVAWRNRDQLPYAWRILTRGVCDGCALGTTGLRDQTMDGVHLCMVRLHLLRLNTMAALDPEGLADAAALANRDGRSLRDLGRLPYPMIRHRGEPGFARVTWEQAIETIATGIRATRPERLAFYLTSRGITNEVYYVAQKVARFLGTNNVDNSARLCHSPSTVALKEMLGVGASSCSYRDWIGTDLIVFLGSDVPNNQPVTTKYLYYARQRGTRVAVVNPYREPGLERYWVPSVWESAIFGTKLADEFYDVHTGGDAAFLTATLKALIEVGAVDRSFIAAHTVGFDEVERAVGAAAWENLEQRAGLPRERIRHFAEELRRARNAVFVWSMGLTQHAHGVDNVRALVNLALARGYLGRAHNGVMPIRGHSGVQGGAEVGCVPDALPGGAPVSRENARRFARLWGFEPPTTPGLPAGEMLAAAGREEIDVFFSVGGNFLDTMPDPGRVRTALSRVPLRVHQDIVVTSQMLVDPAESVVLLPARTRYEQPGGGTETTTERRILFNPEIPGRRIGESRSEWEILQAVAEAARPARRELIHFASAAAIREEIAAAVPAYVGIQYLRKKGDQVQYGGPRLYEDGRFATADGRARFRPAVMGIGDPGEGRFRLSTRRGKQFNSMVHGERDPLNGAVREAVLLSQEDAQELGVSDGDPLRVRSRWGEMMGRALVSAIRSGNVQVHWPEGNVLLPPESREPTSGIPDYNAMVTLEPVATRRAEEERF